MTAVEQPTHTPACRELLAAFSLYLDGDAEPGLCAAIKAHLAGCPACHTVLATLAETIRLCRAHASVPVPAATCARLYAALGLCGGEK